MKDGFVIGLHMIFLVDRIGKTKTRPREERNGSRGIEIILHVRMWSEVPLAVAHNIAAVFAVAPVIPLQYSDAINVDSRKSSREAVYPSPSRRCPSLRFHVLHKLASLEDREYALTT